MHTWWKRHRFALALACLYLYSFPYYPTIRSANELPRIYLTQAMVDEGSFAIDSGVRRHGSTADVSPARCHARGAGGAPGACRRPAAGGTQEVCSCFSNKAPGSSFLAVPAYVLLKGARAAIGGEPTLAEMTWVFRVATGVVPTLLFLLLLWPFLARFAPRPATRRLVIAGYALGTMAMTYSVLFISHQLAAVCIATAYILSVWVIEDGRDVRWLALAGLAAGAAPLVDYQAAFAGVPVAAYLLWRLGVQRRQWRAVLLTIAGCAPPIALLLYYHDSAFGSPLTTGYALSESFAHFHQQGFLGMTELRWEAFVGSTVAPDNGLLFFSPMLLLAIPGWFVLARRRQHWTLGITLSVVVIYLLFISSLNFWRGGWQLGPRYVTAMLPFALVPVAAWVAAIEERGALRALSVGLIAVGILVYGLSSAEYPHFPEVFANPLYEVTLRLIADGYAPYNAGRLIGLSGFASLVPYLILLSGLLFWIAVPTRAGCRSGLAGLVLAAALVGLCAIVPGGGARADCAYACWVAGANPATSVPAVCRRGGCP